MGFSKEDLPKATIVTKVLPDGEKVVALVIKYDTEIDGYSLKPDMFNVEVKIQDKLEKRTIKKVYANANGDLVLSAFSNKGNFVVVELDPKDRNAGTTYFSMETFLSVRTKLEYVLTQKVALKGIDGKTIAPFTVTTNEEKHLVIDDFDALSYTDEELNATILYRFFVPKNIGSDKKYPLVIFLHGAGERGNDNYLQMAGNKGAIVWAEPGHQAEHPCFVLAPQCPPSGSWTELLVGGNPYKPTKDLYAVANLIKKVIEQYPIDPDRVYITGLSMGGFGTFALLTENPDLFAAAIPICGGADINNAEKIKDIPIWVYHAEDDNTVAVESSRSIVRALVEIEGNVKYTEVPKDYLESLGYNSHWSWIPAYENEELIDWLFEQRK